MLDLVPVLLVALLIMSGIIIVLLIKKTAKVDLEILQVFFDKHKSYTRDEFISSRQDIANSIQSLASLLTKQLQDINTSTQTNLNQNAKNNRDAISTALQEFDKRFSKNTDNLIKVIATQLQDIRQDNNQQLEKMRVVVDEKLQSTLEKKLSESFNLVSNRLEQVAKGLGEMQSLASDVGSLQKVLSNVKTRGILGEYQLGSILEQLLDKSQYEINIATKPHSQERVEYAIKMPGQKDDSHILLPIDSKFHLDEYRKLVDVYNEGNKEQIKAQQKQFCLAIEKSAKDIRSKYIEPPFTTEFGLMFLPIESLYAETLRHPELFDKLQRMYNITIVGPTTLAALLNSLQMGFRTLSVQKRSSEVWQVLAQVKTEFNRFTDTLDKVQKQLNTASDSLSTLKTTRTNVMQRKLQSVESIGKTSNDDIDASLDKLTNSD